MTQTPPYSNSDLECMLQPIDLISRTSEILRNKGMEAASRRSSSVLLTPPFSPKTIGIPIDARPRILKSKLPAVSIPDITLPEYIYENIQKHNDKPYLTDGDTGVTLTFSELANLSRRVASGLLRRGYRAGQVLCIYSSNCPEYMVTLLGLWVAGFVPVLLNSALTLEETCRHLADNGTVCLFSSLDTEDIAIGAAQLLKGIKEVFVFNDEFGNRSSRGHPFDQLTSDDGGELTSIPTAKDFDAPLNEVNAIMLYSSGTSGLPKCVQLTHHSVVANLCNTEHPELTLYQEGSSVLCVLPLAHAYASLALAIPCLTRGIPIVLNRKYTFEGSLETIQRFRITCFPLVPPIALRLLQEANTTCARYDLSSLTDIICAAASLAADIEVALKSKFRLKRFRQLFGMSENSPMVSASPFSHHKTGSVGKLYTGNEIMIVDLETRAMLGPYESGEVLLRGPHVTKGYLGNDEATRDMITSDGWMKTGDIGYFDDEDFLFLVDRKKEIIRYKGTQVAPAELEALLLRHPGVKDVAVVGVPDSLAGELPRAYIVPSTVETTEQDIIKFVREKAACFKHLRGGVEFVDSIPKSTTGKILRRVLRQNYLDDHRRLKTRPL